MIVNRKMTICLWVDLYYQDHKLSWVGGQNEPPLLCHSTEPLPSVAGWKFVPPSAGSSGRHQQQPGAGSHRLLVYLLILSQKCLIFIILLVD